MNIKKSVHVAVGVIFHDCEAQELSANNVSNRQILIAKRAEHQHQGGLWEFPGGKVEMGETVAIALARELKEELGIKVSDASPLMQITHDYGDKAVTLDVWKVQRFSGDARGIEGQPIQWVAIEELRSFQFPAANVAIIEQLMAELDSSD